MSAYLALRASRTLCRRLIVSRYAQMNFMTLPDRKQRSGGGGLKSRLLGGIFGLDVSVMENAPLIFDGDDCILRRTHLQLPLHPSSRTSSPVGPFLSARMLCRY